MLSDIGVVFREKVNNRFELSLNNLIDRTDSLDNDSSSKSYSPTHDQKMESKYSRMMNSARRNGVDSSSVIENNSLEPTTPMLALPSSCMLYNRSTEKTYTGLYIIMNYIPMKCLYKLKKVSIRIYICLKI